ncbi:hypothetical protein [Nocardia farcinica]
MSTTSRSSPRSAEAAVARARDGGDRVGQAGGDEGPVEVRQPHRGRRCAGHDHERGRADLGRAVADLVVPAAGRVHHVEQVAAEDDGPGAGRPLAEHAAVLGVVGERPGVQRLAAGTEAVVRAWVGAGDEAVKGHRDVGDDTSHNRSDRIRRANSSVGGQLTDGQHGTGLPGLRRQR